ncbi:MAG: glycosyltransferase family 2 protein [Segetibacter sp.]|nr:glycosyltransferase family 2 protein [Segetibacter sp.]
MNLPAPSVGIGILNWNGKKFLQSLLPELRNISYSNFTIYVIDNNSTDDSITYIRQYHPNVKLIELDRNYGFAEGYNKGFAQMDEDYYLMMNSDVETPATFIEPLVEMMEADPAIAICQPKLLSLLHPDLLEHGGAAGGMIDILGYPFCRGRIFESSEKDKGQYTKPAPIFWASGACCLIRKEAYKKINGMYKFFFMHSEEIDMCWRFIAEGYKIMYCPDSYIYHLGGGTLAYKSPHKTYLNFRNNIIMCFRNSPWYVNLWLLPVRMGLDLIAAFRFLIAEDSANSKAVFVAYKDFIKWLATEKNKFPAKKKSLLSIPVVLHNSIVWQHYIKEVRYYGEL